MTTHWTVNMGYSSMANSILNYHILWLVTEYENDIDDQTVWNYWGPLWESSSLPWMLYATWSLTSFLPQRIMVLGLLVHSPKQDRTLYLHKLYWNKLLYEFWN